MENSKIKLKYLKWTTAIISAISTICYHLKHANLSKTGLGSPLCKNYDNRKTQTSVLFITCDAEQCRTEQWHLYENALYSRYEYNKHFNLKNSRLGPPSSVASSPENTTVTGRWKLKSGCLTARKTDDRIRRRCMSTVHGSRFAT